MLLRGRQGYLERPQSPPRIPRISFQVILSFYVVFHMVSTQKARDENTDMQFAAMDPLWLFKKTHTHIKRGAGGGPWNCACLPRPSAGREAEPARPHACPTSSLSLTAGGSRRHGEKALLGGTSPCVFSESMRLEMGGPTQKEEKHKMAWPRKEKWKGQKNKSMKIHITSTQNPQEAFTWEAKEAI